MRKRPVVAIDGPAGSGKSTTARAVAEALGFCHLDSGALYRAITWAALRELGGDPNSWSAETIVAAARRASLGVSADGPALRVTLAGSAVGEEIRGEQVTREVSRVSAMGPVREFATHLLREAAKDGGVVMDGRDIGTVVFPDAEIKVFLVAEAEVRARRRLTQRGVRLDERTVRAEAGALVQRDEHDRGREVAPLAKAGDAVVIDTTKLSFEEQVRRVVELVRRPGLRLTGDKVDLEGRGSV
jgi:cytidylate kinase